MAFSADQLETWSHQGATGISSEAYGRIQRALTADSSPLKGRGVEIFLQGSYANDTNTYGDSDIDVVVLYPDTFYEDLSALSPQELEVHRQHFSPATYHWTNLRADTLKALQSYFGMERVDGTGRRSIKVITGAGRMTADVVPAVQFRRYATYPNPETCTAYWGMKFFDSSNAPIVNYPKYHIERGREKNVWDRTHGRYKTTIRVFKNLRSFLVDRAYLNKSQVPSYFLECLLSNIPDHIFHSAFSKSVPDIITAVAATNPATLLSQNRVVPLIGTDSTQWNLQDLNAFISTAQYVWSHN